MEVLSDFIKIILPAGLVLLTMFLVVKSFLEKDMEKKLAEVESDLKSDNNKVILPLKLQAYERMCLFLERIALQNLVIRVNDPSFNVSELQAVLLKNIRDEFNHNLSQQVYISHNAWLKIKSAMEDNISLINTAAGELSGDQKGRDLAKNIFDMLMKRQKDPIGDALRFIKQEFNKLS